MKPVYKFAVSITTALGNCSGDLYANSLQQIKDNMPDQVTICDITIGNRCPDYSPKEEMDMEVQIDLESMVSNIEYAATMTPEKIAAEHAEQLRALSGMTVRLR